MSPQLTTLSFHRAAPPIPWAGVFFYRDEAKWPPIPTDGRQSRNKTTDVESTHRCLESKQDTSFCVVSDRECSVSPGHCVSLAAPRAAPSSHPCHPGRSLSYPFRGWGFLWPITRGPGAGWTEESNAPAPPGPEGSGGTRILLLRTACGLTRQAILKSAGRTLLGSCHSGLTWEPGGQKGTPETPGSKGQTTQG